MLAKRRRSSLDSLFDFPFPGIELSRPYDNVHVDENGDFVYRLGVPGVAREEVKVSVTPEDRLLSVETPNTIEKRTVSRDYSLEDIYASVENGLLEIKIPRRKKNVIEIEVH